MKLRVVEWLPERSIGWVRITDEQMAASPPAMVLPAVRIENDEEPCAQAHIPGDVNFASDREDSLRVVLHHGATEPTEKLERILLDALPRLTSVSRVAEILRDPRDESMVMAEGNGGRYLNVRRVRLAVPGALSPEGAVRWTYGTVMLFEQTAFVSWNALTQEGEQAAAGVDVAARNGSYRGIRDEKTVPLSRLGNSYLEANLAAIERTMLDGRRRLDLWEADFVSRTGDNGSSSDEEIDFTTVRNLRRIATSARVEVDELRRRVLAAQSWSDTRGTKVMDQELASAFAATEEAIGRLRTDVGDSLNLLNTVRVGQQLAASKAAGDRAQRLQTTVSNLTAFLLVPALIGTIFGADVALPGASPRDQAVIMYIAMALGAVLTFAGIRLHARHASKR